MLFPDKPTDTVILGCKKSTIPDITHTMHSCIKPQFLFCFSFSLIAMLLFRDECNYQIMCTTALLSRSGPLLLKHCFFNNEEFEFPCFFFLKTGTTQIWKSLWSTGQRCHLAGDLNDRIY